MEQVERYLKALKSGLPEEQREDIFREFSENLYAEIEEKESSLGRAVNPDEIDAILNEHGNPLVVASRFRQDQRSVAFGRQLVGPTLFPFYIRVLKFNLGLTGAVILIIFTALLAGGKVVGISGGLSVLFWNLLIQLVAITAIFAGMDHYIRKHPQNWHLGKGRPVQLRDWQGLEGQSRVSRSSTCSQIISLGISIGWLSAIQTHPFFIFGPAAAFLRLAPVWHQVYPAMVFVYLVFVVQAVANFVRPEWVRLPQMARAVTSVMWLVIYYFLFKAGVWVQGTAEASEGYQRGIAIANQVIFYCLIAAVLVTLGMLSDAVRRMSVSPSRGEAQKATANS